jgi:flagellar protein FliO/FliZ
MQNVSKITRLVCVFWVLCAVMPLGAQQAASRRQAQGAAGSTTVVAGSQKQTSDETAIYLDAAANPAVAQAAKPAGPSSIWILVRVVLVLALVCAGIYGVVYLMKKSTGAKAGNDPYLKNIASLYFSPNKSVQVISLGERAYLVGVTDQAINLIAEVQDKELVDAMNLQSDKKNPLPTGTFQSVISNFFPGAGKKESGSGTAPGSGPNETATAGFPDQESVPFADDHDAPLSGVSMLRAQRERLQRSGRVGEDVGRGPIGGGEA